MQVFSFNPDELIAYLNQLLEIDREAITALMETRVPCNDRLADHPTVQVHQKDPHQCEVGPLGILNGMCGVREDGWGHITAVYEGESIVRFERTDR